MNARRHDLNLLQKKQKLVMWLKHNPRLGREETIYTEKYLSYNHKQCGGSGNHHVGVRQCTPTCTCDTNKEHDYAHVHVGRVGTSTSYVLSPKRILHYKIQQVNCRAHTHAHTHSNSTARLPGTYTAGPHPGFWVRGKIGQMKNIGGAKHPAVYACTKVHVKL